MTEAARRRTSLLLLTAGDSDAARFGAMLEQASPLSFEVARVTTLAEATTHLETMIAECVVLDLDLPRAATLEVVGTLATIAPGAVLIVLTDSDDNDLGLATIETGASDCLPKEKLDGELLVRSVRFAMRRNRFATSLAEAESIAQVGSFELDVTTRSVSWSRELYRLFGLRPDEKPTYDVLIDRIHPDDRDSVEKALAVTMAKSTPYLEEHRLLLPDGTLRWIRVSGRVELDSSGRPLRLVGVLQDITEKRVAENALAHHALHDPLSGLPNRILFVDRLGQALKRLERHPSTVCVIYLDVDRFRVINDSLGHANGDQLLMAMADRLAALVRPGDTLARIGGDEFVMLCEGLSDEEDAVGVADRIRAAMTVPITVAGEDIVLSASAGIALAESDSSSPDHLLRDAEAAMYLAKSAGRARSTVFAQTMRTKAIGRLETEKSLRQSIMNGDLRVHYQPIVTLADGRVLGHEALVRWDHPTRGLLAPDQFITIAEETGLIAPLGTAVLREACRQAKVFQGLDPSWSRLTMSVNLSGGQLGQRDLTELVALALHDSGLKAEHLQLEMTESVLMDDAAATITILTSLKGLGVRLGIDDFGTGYSSLAYLRRFPVDVLKIDRSFVDGLGKDLEDSAVVAAVVSLADALGLTTIAEGVETPLQRDCLVALGCSRAQGYLFSRPVDASACERALGGQPEERRDTNPSHSRVRSS